MVLEGMVAGEPRYLEPVLSVIQLTPIRYGEGWFTFSWSPGDAWVNPSANTVFGGAAAAALEYAFGASIATILDDGQLPAAIRLEQDYVVPVRAGNEHSVTGRVVSRAGQTMFCRGEITDAEERIAVLGSGVCRVIQPKSM